MESFDRSDQPTKDPNEDERSERKSCKRPIGKLVPGNDKNLLTAVVRRLYAVLSDTVG